MPHYCIVPLCNNQSGTPGISFYRLPLKDPDLLKQWLVKIRREDVPLTKYSRVCSVHFEGGRKIGKKAVPTIFAWTKHHSRPPPKNRSLPVEKSPSKPLTTLSSTSNASLQNPQPEVVSVDAATQYEDSEEGTHHENNFKADASTQYVDTFKADASTQYVDTFKADASTQYVDTFKADASTQYVDTFKADASTQYVDTFKADASTQYIGNFKVDASTHCEVLKAHTEVQCSVDIVSKLTQTDTTTVHQIIQTDDLDEDGEVTPFRIEQIKDNNKLVNFYTGFPSFLHLLTCFHFLGPAVATLCYDPDKSVEDPTKVCGMGRPHILTPLNEFFLTLCRIRLGLLEQDLAIRFQVSQPTVSRIVMGWINLLYVKFKEVPIWPSREAVNKFMPITFRMLYPTTRCIIDATEIFIQMPSNPTAQQLTFSSYKNHNTLKALVAITPSGAVCFVSDLFSGNISDKRLVAESGLLKLLEVGDSIMADRGFIIDDILPAGITLNVPPMLNETGQLTEDERTRTRRIASVRIHVERAIERIKNYQILHDVPNNMHNSINQIFFVCAMLTNFLPPLVS